MLSFSNLSDRCTHVSDWRVLGSQPHHIPGTAPRRPQNFWTSCIRPHAITQQPKIRPTRYQTIWEEKCFQCRPHPGPALAKKICDVDADTRSVRGS